MITERAEPRPLWDGPNTHKYTTANHITSWTVIPLHDPVTAIKHWYHVPTVVVEEIERAARATRGEPEPTPPPPLDVERLRTALQTTEERYVSEVIAGRDPATFSWPKYAVLVAVAYNAALPAATPSPSLDALNGGRCAAQAETARHGWVQCVKLPFHEDRHVWGDDNQITPAEPFA